ncbi:MAG TPA: helix-turn-helix transcriptional regulator [Stellaceae bacterium]|jgi:transcriptional regulator with XRE-family HTH domain|nr:helix-turn-helix transcriptional regulator [Stellaceae bacterium]
MKHITTVDQQIGARLRAHRMAARMSQTDIGQGLGVTFQQVQKYEKGSNRISGHKLIDVCKLLQIKPDQLLGTNGTSYAVGRDPLESLNNRDVAKMLTAINTLAPKQRSLVTKAFLSMVEAFKGKELK